MRILPLVNLRGFVLLLLSLSGVASAEDSVDPKKLKSPIPFTKKSIAQGRSTYARFCVGCHGADGKATMDVVADATDLTAPKTWKSGTTDGDMFVSIRDGRSASMPAFKTQIKKEEDLWHLVNFIHSLWPESMRPPLQESTESSTGNEK
jgi:mono/diheme cytochrome c family protein